MTFILDNATDERLAASVEENLFALFREIAKLPGSELIEGEALSYHDTTFAAPMFKSVWGARLEDSAQDAAVTGMINHFKGRGAPLLAWWFNPSTPLSLLARLEARGFELDYNAPGMVIDLASIPQPLHFPDGLTIVQARDERTLDDWSQALYLEYEEYHMPLSSARVWADATLTLGADNAPWRLYIAYWNGQPVATNLIFDGAGVSGLFCVGTIPAARGKGIGAAITLQPLLDSRTLGYQYGVLFASDIGLPMYAKIGWRRVPISIGRYLWIAE